MKNRRNELIMLFTLLRGCPCVYLCDYLNVHARPYYEKVFIYNCCRFLLLFEGKIKRKKEREKEIEKKFVQIAFELPTIVHLNHHTYVYMSIYIYINIYINIYIYRLNSYGKSRARFFSGSTVICKRM